MLDCLARAVVVERRRQSRTERQLVAEWCQEQLDAWKKGSAPPAMAGLPWTFEVVTALLWLSECLQDAELAAQFEEALPPELKKKYPAAVPPEAPVRSRLGTAGRRRASIACLPKKVL